jgi:two-component system sensor histidine kinase PrrB
MSSLRTQITVAAVLLVVCAVALSGVAIALRIDHQDRAQVDQQLRDRIEKVRADESKSRDTGTSVLGEDVGPGRENSLLAGTDTITRVLSNGRVVAQRGDGIPEGTTVAARAGWSTVTIAGHRWRSLVEPYAATPQGQVQVLQSLEPVEQRLHANARLIAEVGALATLVTAIAVWLVAGMVLRPLGRLRSGVRTIRPGASQRLPQVGRPQEIADLSATLNAMLARLETSMLATRRFTADAGHELRTPITGLGMDLETLSTNPDLPQDRRSEIHRALLREHRRIVALLDGLQRLARGDAEALPDRPAVDVAGVVSDAVEPARRRHRGVTFLLEGVATAHVVDGWEDGVALAVTNLLDNAALHGRPDGQVDVAVARGEGVVHITVCDDGPGIPPAERERVLERFARGRDTRSSGSGLGLALVEQQAHLHGGRVELDESPSGGLRARLSLPERSPTHASGTPGKCGT